MTMKAPQGEETLHEVPGRDDAALAAAAALFRGFGDPSRLAIVCHLALGEHNVRDLTEHLGLAQSTVSAHLRCLLDCGMVTVRAQGRASVYALTADAQILDLLMAAERLLAATGDAVTFCPRYGTHSGSRAERQP
jgi:ArsR family transcriptional regulator, cadmium/lead-responsive transcriptional repressor